MSKVAPVRHGVALIHWDDENIGWQATVDTPHNGRLNIGPVHPDLGTAMTWLDRAEAAFERDDTCKSCGDVIECEAVEDEGFEYCASCAGEMGIA